MLTWEQLATREPACRRCKGRFHPAGPFDAPELAEIRRLLEAGHPVSAIRFIRERSGSSLVDAKGTYEHVTIQHGACRQCRSPLNGDLYSDCMKCDALNIDA